MRRTCILSLVLFAVLFLSCEKYTDNGMSHIPRIDILDVTPLSIEEFDGNVIVKLRYQDGNGDLGFEHPDSLALEVKDVRLLNPDWYYVPPLAPLTSVVSIEGELSIVLHGTFIFGNGMEEETYFTLRIRDRAGNWSNTVETPTITIYKP